MHKSAESYLYLQGYTWHSIIRFNYNISLLMNYHDMSKKSALPFSVSYKNLFSEAIWLSMNYFIHPQLHWHTLQTLNWWWDHTHKEKVHQAISFEELITHPPHKHAQVNGCWNWQWKAMISFTDSIPPCTVQLLCATVTLFSSTFCFSEKLPSLVFRSFRITTWRKNKWVKIRRFSTTAICPSFST